MAGAAVIGVFLSLFLGTPIAVFATVLIGKASCVFVPPVRLYLCCQRAWTPVNAVRSVNSSYGLYGGHSRSSQYGNYWGSQYGSSDHLNVPHHQAPPAEYTWWRKAKEQGCAFGAVAVRTITGINMPARASTEEGMVPEPSIEVNTTQPAHPGALPITDDRTVAFEENENWLGRTR
ncbi:hypothetical protein BC939DRAFT_478965 [Gamsiella multidivaricata]|uniref:uncharacterized protein n=1 Tax=Gamsiella multidivaricata TaxID=101098 RepID=UPI002220FEAD|nr:uncharacterized protein BC939DRAFT_478965 [Gamsiella multidivaricata]KAI7820461.1 hypothetical protein BC939DRAFT_478965 [Gamsiella multidivaricata]